MSEEVRLWDLTGSSLHLLVRGNVDKYLLTSGEVTQPKRRIHQGLMW